MDQLDAIRPSAWLCMVPLIGACLTVACSSDQLPMVPRAGNAAPTGVMTGPNLGSSGVGAPGAAGSVAGRAASPGTAGSTVSATAGTAATGVLPSAGSPGAAAAGAMSISAGSGGAIAAAGSGGAAGVPSAGTTGQAGATGGTGTCTASKATGTNATGTGPHKVVVETNPGSGGIAEGVIFRPMDLGGAEKYPIFAWGEGGCQQNGLSNAAVMGEIASHGYFVIADGTPNGTSMRAMGANTAAMGKPLLAYIDWAISENDKPCSAYYQSLDTKKIATNGFSCGGLMAEGTAGDPRITTWGLNSSGLFSADTAFYKTVHTPVLIVLGGSADIAYTNGERDYDNISALGMPIMLFSKNGSNHGGDLMNGKGDFAKIDVAWLNWWLKGDETATGKGVLVGSTCTYCTDSGWEVKSMNIP
jgi:hypothetical protein